MGLNTMQHNQDMNKLFYIINLVDNYAFNKMIGFLQPKGRKAITIGFVIFSFILILGCLSGFQIFKQKNLFEIMQIDRIHTEQELNENFELLKNELQQKYQNESNPQKLQEIYQEMADIKEIYNLLKNPVRKTVYDKYMDTSSEVNINYLSPYQQIKFIINTGSSYMIILLLVLINVDKKSLKKGIELVFINLVIFIMLELYYIMNDTDKTDLIDTILPRMTIQERGELQKMLIGPLMFIIIKYTQLFVQNSEEITYLQLLKTYNLLKNEYEKKVLQNKEIGQDKDMELSQDQKNIVNKIQELKQQILNYYKNHYKKMDIQGINDLQMEYQDIQQNGTENIKNKQKAEVDENEEKKKKNSAFIYIILIVVLFQDNIRDLLGI